VCVRPPSRSPGPRFGTARGARETRGCTRGCTRAPAGSRKRGRLGLPALATSWSGRGAARRARRCCAIPVPTSLRRTSAHVDIEPLATFGASTSTFGIDVRRRRSASTFGVERSASNVRHRTSGIERPTSNVRHRTSGSERATSAVARQAPMTTPGAIASTPFSGRTSARAHREREGASRYARAHARRGAASRYARAHARRGGASRYARAHATREGRVAGLLRAGASCVRRRDHFERHFVRERGSRVSARDENPDG
jgi:hypothetical protein